MRRYAFLLAFVISTAACGGSDNGSPTAPGPFIPNFNGVWVGTWARQSCSETGGAVGVGCGSLPSTGGLRLSFAQTSTTVDGTVEVGTVVANVSGTVTEGTLAVTGQGRFQDFAITISNWSTTVSGATMSGAFTFTLIPDDTTAGTVIVRAGLQNVVK